MEIKIKIKLTERNTQLVAVTFVLADCLPQIIQPFHHLVAGGSGEHNNLVIRADYAETVGHHFLPFVHFYLFVSLFVCLIYY